MGTNRLRKLRLIFYGILSVNIILSIFLFHYVFATTTSEADEEKMPVMIELPPHGATVGLVVNSILYLVCAFLARKIEKRKKERRLNMEYTKEQKELIDFLKNARSEKEVVERWGKPDRVVTFEEAKRNIESYPEMEVRERLMEKELSPGYSYNCIYGNLSGMWLELRYREEGGLRRAKCVRNYIHPKEQEDAMKFIVEAKNEELVAERYGAPDIIKDLDVWLKECQESASNEMYDWLVAHEKKLGYSHTATYSDICGLNVHLKCAGDGEIKHFGFTFASREQQGIMAEYSKPYFIYYK